MINLSGKYAIVTGAAKGIGAAIVKKFLEEEIAGVAMIDINEAQLKQTVAELDPSGTRLFPLVCNISFEEQVHEVVAKATKHFGTIDILINNAGITRDSMFHKMTSNQWKQVIDINLNGTFYMCKEVVPIFREKGYGKIVNISSISAFGNIGQANYASTKSALLGLTYTLARELGPKNINVNAIAPGYIVTDMFAAVPEHIQESWKAGIPKRRFGTAEELANVAAFLSSDESSWITGECITASGGVLTV